MRNFSVRTNRPMDLGTSNYRNMFCRDEDGACHFQIMKRVAQEERRERGKMEIYSFYFHRIRSWSDVTQQPNLSDLSLAY